MRRHTPEIRVTSDEFGNGLSKRHQDKVDLFRVRAAMNVGQAGILRQSALGRAPATGPAVLRYFAREVDRLLAGVIERRDLGALYSSSHNGFVPDLDTGSRVLLVIV